MKPPTTKEVIEALTADLDCFINGKTTVTTVGTCLENYFVCDITVENVGDKYQIKDAHLPRQQCTNTMWLYPSQDEQRKRAEICKELEFLHTVMHPTKVSNFQTYVSRLWAMDTYPPRPDVMKFIDDFLMSQRDFTCKL